MAEEKKQPEKQKKNLWIYLIALFSLSIVLILLSYGSQLRLKRELTEANQSLEEKWVTASGAVEQAGLAWELAEEQRKALDELRGRVDMLEQQGKTQQAALDLLNTALAEQQEKTAAADALWRLTELVRAKKYADARTLLAEMEEMGLVPRLSEEGQAQVARVEELI